METNIYYNNVVDFYSKESMLDRLNSNKEVFTLMHDKITLNLSQILTYYSELNSLPPISTEEKFSRRTYTPTNFYLKTLLYLAPTLGLPLWFTLGVSTNFINILIAFSIDLLALGCLYTLDKPKKNKFKKTNVFHSDELNAYHLKALSKPENKIIIDLLSKSEPKYKEISPLKLYKEFRFKDKIEFIKINDYMFFHFESDLMDSSFKAYPKEYKNCKLQYIMTKAIISNNCKVLNELEEVFTVLQKVSELGFDKDFYSSEKLKRYLKQKIADICGAFEKKQNKVKFVGIDTNSIDIEKDIKIELLKTQEEVIYN